MIKTRLMRLYIVFSVFIAVTTGVLFYSTFKKVVISELKTILKQHHGYIQIYINNTFTCSMQCYYQALGDKLINDISRYEIDKNGIIGLVRDIRFKETGIAYITDDDGNILYHPDQSLINKKHDLSEWISSDSTDSFKDYIVNDKQKYLYKFRTDKAGMNIIIDCHVSEFITDNNLDRLEEYIIEVGEKSGIDIFLVTEDYKFVIDPLMHKKISVTDIIPLFEVKDNFFMESGSRKNMDFILGFYSKENFYNWTIAVSGSTSDILKNGTILKRTFLTTLQPTILLFLLFIIVFFKHIYELKLKDQNLEIINTQKELLCKLGETVETRSRETSNHVKRVASISKFIASKYGIRKSEREIIKSAAPLHDIGKVGISDSILNNPGKLTQDEYNEMKEHTVIGYNLLNGSEKPLLKYAAIIALEHHEYWNGKGYPYGKKGEEIHIYARIVHIADVIDALLSKRSYKEAWEPEKVFKYLREERGEMFDPDLVDIVLNNKEKVLSLFKMKIQVYAF